MNRIVCLLAGTALALPLQAAAAAPPAELNPEHVVREWAETSRGAPPRTQSANQRTLHTYRNHYNGHQIALICEFRGPVDADDLLARYRFMAARRDGDAIRLTAVPRDVVETLFLPEIELTLDAASSLPSAIRFAGNPRQTDLRPVTLLNRWQRAAIVQADGPASDRTTTVLRVASSAMGDGTVVQAAGVHSPARRMPSVIGLPWKAVRTHFLEAGYAVHVRYEPAANAAANAAEVVGQFPGKGQPLAAGAEIVLIVPGNAAD